MLTRNRLKGGSYSPTGVTVGFPILPVKEPRPAVRPAGSQASRHRYVIGAGPFRVPCDDQPPRSLSADRALSHRHAPARYAPYDILGAIGQPTRRAGAVSARRS